MTKSRSSKSFMLIASTLFFLCGLVLVSTSYHPVAAAPDAQLPTVAMATVTSSPIGPYIIVNLDQDQINVRQGPSTLYPIVGLLQAGQDRPAKGRNGDWILIDYAGVPTGTAWVYGPLVKVFGALPIVEPPPTPTPLVTATIDATLAAQFITTPETTRLPTYTSAPTIAIPKFSDEAGGGSMPVGWVILFVGLLGIILGLLSFFQGR